jgi:hypothetical protein
MKRIYPVLIVIALGILVGVYEIGNGATPVTGPHGGSVVGAEGQKVEVLIEPRNRRVNVYVLKSTRDFPGEIGLLLRTSQGRESTLALKTIPGSRELLQYSSGLDDNTQPIVGFELRVPFLKGKPLVIHSGNEP